MFEFLNFFPSLDRGRETLINLLWGGDQTTVIFFKSNNFCANLLKKMLFHVTFTSNRERDISSEINYKNNISKKILICFLTFQEIEKKIQASPELRSSIENIFNSQWSFYWKNPIFISLFVNLNRYSVKAI